MAAGRSFRDTPPFTKLVVAIRIATFQKNYIEINQSGNETDLVMST